MEVSCALEHHVIDAALDHYWYTRPRCLRTWPKAHLNIACDKRKQLNYLLRMLITDSMFRHNMTKFIKFY